MFKRLHQNGGHRQREPIVIGRPVLLHTTFDENALEQIPHVSDVRHGLITPVGTPESIQRIDDSIPRTVSSGISSAADSRSLTPEVDLPLSVKMASRTQQAPVPRLDTSYVSGPYGEVSPPDSPAEWSESHGGGSSRRRSPSVSPLNEIPEHPPWKTSTSTTTPTTDTTKKSSTNYASNAPKFTSHIPLLRTRKQELNKAGLNTGEHYDQAPQQPPPLEEPPQQRETSPQSRSSPVPRWVDYIKESQSSTAKAPAKAKSREDLRQSDSSRPMGVSTSITGGTAREEMAKNAAKTAKRPFGFGLGLTNGGEREDGKRLGGFRSSTANVNKQLPREPDMPSPRPVATRSPSIPAQDFGSGRSTPLSFVQQGGSPLVGGMSPNFESEDDIRPVVPLKVGRNSPPHTRVTSSETIKSPSTEALSPYRSERRDTQAAIESVNESVQAMNRDFHAAFNDLSIRPQDPPSRFSFSTEATESTTALNRSTPSIPSTPDPNHSYSQSYSQTPSQTQSPAPRFTPSDTGSVLNRGRPPIGDRTPESRNIRRKPAPSISESLSPLTAAAAAASTDSIQIPKRLPVLPTESKPVDLISSLKTQLNDLALRRAHLESVMKDLTEGLPEYPSSIRSREESKHKVEDCRNQLADVQNHEHTLGLRLYRAQKRQDSTSQYEPTGLWIRRVTG